MAELLWQSPGAHAGNSNSPMRDSAAVFFAINLDSQLHRILANRFTALPLSPYSRL
jgi:hypothetical protein